MSATRASPTGSAVSTCNIATENVAGGLLDLADGWSARGRHRPVGRCRRRSRRRYDSLWNELTAPEEFAADETYRIEQRLSGSTSSASTSRRWRSSAHRRRPRLRYIPRVVEHGFHSDRLKSLTGLETDREPGAPAARRHPHLRYRAAPSACRGALAPGSAAAAPRERGRRALARPAIRTARSPSAGELHTKLEAAEIYHQLLEHRWFLSEDAQRRRAARAGAGRPTSSTCWPRPRRTLYSVSRPPSCRSSPMPRPARIRGHRRNHREPTSGTDPDEPSRSSFRSRPRTNRTVGSARRYA